MELNRKNYIFIDYENVQPSLLNLPNNNFFKVILFIGASQTKISVELSIAMHILGNNAEYVQITDNGKNALDFHITFYLGKFLEIDPNGYFHIISKDCGYDILINHLRNKHLLVQRYNKIDDIVVLGLKTMDEKINLVIEYLIKRAGKNPKTVVALTNTINSLFMNSLNKIEVSTLINKLSQKKIISIEETVIHYKL